MGIATCYAYAQKRTVFVPLRSVEYILKFQITTSGSAAQSPVMPTATEYVVIEPDTECHIKKDAVVSTPIATATDPTVYVGNADNQFLIGAGEYFSLIE